MQQEFVNLPNQVVTFFKKKGLYLPLPSSNKENTAITYKNAIGDALDQIPSEFSNDEKLMNTVFEYKYKCRDEKLEERCNKVILKILKSMFGNQQYEIVDKAIMVNTGTTPLRVNYKTDTKKRTKSLYIKQPDAYRLIGKSLYDIISGIRPRKFMFNRAAFVEEAIPGKVVAELDEKLLLQEENYIRGITRAIVHSSFLEVADICTNERNRIVKNKSNATVLFDFNIMFQGPGVESLTKHCIDQFRKYELKFPTLLFSDNCKKERALVIKRLNSNHEFWKIIKVVSNIGTREEMSLDQWMKEKYGARTFSKYFEKKVEWFKKLAARN